MPNLVNFGKGTAADEQDLVTNMVNFAVGICGWEVVNVLADSSTDHMVALKSSGTEPGRFKDLYYTIRGNSNYIDLSMYTRYVDETPDYDSKIYNSDYTRTPCSSTSFNWWGFGDEDGIWFVWVSAGSYFSAFMGYINSYYPDSKEQYSGLCIGQLYNSRWFDTARCLGYQNVDATTTTSGLPRSYLSIKTMITSIGAYQDPSTRDGTDQLGMPIIMYRPYGATAEVRGELRHALCFSGATLSNEDWYTISGTEYKYFIQRYANDATTGFGPVSTSSGTEW